MRSGKLVETLVLHSKESEAYTYSESHYRLARGKSDVKVILEQGIMKYRLHFNREGTLTEWERFTFLKTTAGQKIFEEKRKFHAVEVVSGGYSAQDVEDLISLIKTEKPVDVAIPNQ